MLTQWSQHSNPASWALQSRTGTCRHHGVNTPTQWPGFHRDRTQGTCWRHHPTLQNSFMDSTVSETELVDTLESALQHSVMDFTYSEALLSCFHNGNSALTQCHGLHRVETLWSRWYYGVITPTRHHGFNRHRGVSLAPQPHVLCRVKDLHPGVSNSKQHHGHYRVNSMVLLTPWSQHPNTASWTLQSCWLCGARASALC